ncbi:hypothetical protein [Prosthecobacter sp.]|uniref:hypothetical protein n=1 Tax=Prosthecobacter sp. TaxID=1965333 RepID=UPI003784F5ED
MNYPLTFTFKFFALAPQIYVTDAHGSTVCYVKQKLFRFREKVEVFTDDTMRTPLATIEADRIIDWSARYTFKSPTGQVLGAVGRRGMKSLWRAHYDVFAPGAQSPAFAIQEANPWTKMLDGLVGQIPVVGLFTGFMLHPVYIASRGEQGAPVVRLTKQSAFFEGRFGLTQEGPADDGEQLALLLSFLMMNLLERARG